MRRVFCNRQNYLNSFFIHSLSSCCSNRRIQSNTTTYHNAYYSDGPKLAVYEFEDIRRVKLFCLSRFLIWPYQRSVSFTVKYHRFGRFFFLFASLFVCGQFTTQHSDVDLTKISLIQSGTIDREKNWQKSNIIFSTQSSIPFGLIFISISAWCVRLDSFFLHLLFSFQLLWVAAVSLVSSWFYKCSSVTKCIGLTQLIWSTMTSRILNCMWCMVCMVYRLSVAWCLVHPKV